MPRLPRRGECLHAHRAGGSRGRAPGHEHPRPRQDHRRGLRQRAGALALGGRARNGKRSYVQYESFAGGVGGRNGKGSTSATCFHLSNGKIAPVEIIESEFPTQVERFELLPDSGGPPPPRWPRLRPRVPHPPGRSPFLHAHRQTPPSPQGIDGGHPGGTGGCVTNPGGEDERSLPSRFGDQRLKTGDVLRVKRPGGGGVGAAFERSPEAVLNDVRQGYVSVEQARSDYGVVVRPHRGEVTLDPDATGELRGKQNAGSC